MEQRQRQITQLTRADEVTWMVTEFFFLSFSLLLRIIWILLCFQILRLIFRCWKIRTFIDFLRRMRCWKQLNRLIWRGPYIPKDISATVLILLPQVSHARQLGDYRPIILGNFSIKDISYTIG